MKRKLLLFIGLLLIVIAFIIYKYSMMRFMILIIGMGLIIYQCFINKANKIVILLLAFLLLFGTFGFDYFLSKNTRHIPIYSLKIKSSNKMAVYNSIFYRVYDCNSKLIIDNNYKLSYACSADDLEEQDINSFLNESIKSYEEYHNKFIKLNGKISKLSGLDVIELSSYKQAENSLNGYVIFNTDYTVRLTTDYDISKLKIYDNITVIGLVSSMEQQKDNYLINLIDTLVIPSKIYDDYTIEVVENNNKGIEDFIEKTNYYKIGLDNIYIHYDNNNVYELSYLITDSRITLDEILNSVNYGEIKNKDEEVVAQKYSLEKYNVLKCLNNEKVIFANKNIKLNADYCK